MGLLRGMVKLTQPGKKSSDSISGLVDFRAAAFPSEEKGGFHGDNLSLGGAPHCRARAARDSRKLCDLWIALGNEQSMMRMPKHGRKLNDALVLVLDRTPDSCGLFGELPSPSTVSQRTES
jgi:hypothetical protein